MDNRHGLVTIFDNDLHTSTHVCQERRYVGRGSFFFRNVHHALSHSLIIQLATPNPHARKTGVEYPMEILETFPAGPSSGPGHSAAKVETGTPSHTPVDPHLKASNISVEGPFSSVQGSSRPPRKSYWRSYCLFL